MAERAVMLDLGCGTAKVPGAIGIDVVPLEGVDLIGNLAERPYPFAPNSFDAVYLNDVIEHIPNTIRTMEEVYRILKPNGRAYVRVVNWNSIYTAMDPTHLAAYTENSFDFFGKRVGRSYYTRARFDVVKVKRRYNPLAERFCPNERLLYFFSQFFCNVLEDLTFELRAVKPKETQVTYPRGDLPGWFALLRCPQALVEGKEGKLRLWRECWLICDETGCKYPVAGGVPRVNSEEAERWRAVAVEDLPVPAPEVEWVPVEDKPIESISQQDDSWLLITSPRDLFNELRKTYFHPWRWTKSCVKLLALAPIRVTRRCLSTVKDLLRTEPQRPAQQYAEETATHQRKAA